MADNDGGAIYPIDQGMHSTCVAGEPCRVSAGLTIRDFFAAAALPETVRTWRGGTRAEFASKAAVLAYEIADAMLKARGKQQEPQRCVWCQHDGALIASEDGMECEDDEACLERCEQAYRLRMASEIKKAKGE